MSLPGRHCQLYMRLKRVRLALGQRVKGLAGGGRVTYTECIVRCNIVLLYYVTTILYCIV